MSDEHKNCKNCKFWYTDDNSHCINCHWCSEWQWRDEG